MQKSPRRRSIQREDVTVAIPASASPAKPESPGSAGPGYSVRILYTEPEFRLRNPDTPPYYSFKLKYEGVSSPREALERALDYYESCYRDSGVGWRRVIKSLILEPF